jgi:hypothetical protein
VSITILVKTDIFQKLFLGEVMGVKGLWIFRGLYKGTETSQKDLYKIKHMLNFASLRKKIRTAAWRSRD